MNILFSIIIKQLMKFSLRLTEIIVLKRIYCFDLNN